MTKTETWEEIERVILTVKENFILLYSGRGVGKTYTAIKTFIDYCIANDCEFALVLPTETEAEKGALKNWVDKVRREKYKGVDFTFTQGNMYYRLNEDDDRQRIGCSLSLSQAEKAKKRGDLARVKFMVMDEAIISSAALMAGFVYNFNVLYETIDRERNETRAIFMGNTLNKINPLFDFFEVTLNDLKKPGTITRSLNKYAWYIPKPSDLNKDNIFRQMVNGTGYGTMADGYFRTNYGEFIEYPPNGLYTYSAFNIAFGDTQCLGILTSNGCCYLQSVSKEFAEQYTKQCYNAHAIDATAEAPMIPKQLRELIRHKIERGKLRFIDEEAFLILAPKIQFLTGVKII